MFEKYLGKILDYSPLSNPCCVPRKKIMINESKTGGKLPRGQNDFYVNLWINWNEALGNKMTASGTLEEWNGKFRKEATISQIFYFLTWD